MEQMKHIRKKHVSVFIGLFMVAYFALPANWTSTSWGEPVPEPPTVTVTPASNITTSSAVLNVTVNAQGDSTTISFQYGLTTEYEDSIPATPSNLSSSITESVSASITNLSPNTTYSYRIVATNTAGTIYGDNQTFSTPADLPGQPQSVGVTAGDGMATVTFFAPVSNGGSTITGYTVTASPGGITTSGTGSPVVISGLTNGVEYTFTVTATNSAGTGPASGASNSVIPRNVQTITFNNPGDQMIQINLSIDGKLVRWNNPDSPVTIKIPYQPTAGELQNPGSIVIWYIDGAGNAIPVPNGQFDASSGMVTFRITHFSDYAVAYNPAKFTDVSEKAWYKDAVTFLAARGITKGTGKDLYSPNANLSRAEFVVLMMRAAGLEPDQDSADNFSDAGNSYYTGYLAAAKRLGITEGIGGNQFAPANSITKQEMASLLYRTLKAQKRLAEAAPTKGAPAFTDTDKVAEWAKEPMNRLAQLGIINGSAGRLNPTATTTRAEMAQVLTNLLKQPTL